MAHVAAAAREHRRHDGASENLHTYGGHLEIQGDDGSRDLGVWVRVDQRQTEPDEADANYRAGFFVYAIQLTSSEPQEQSAIQRMLELVSSLPQERKDALTTMPFAEALLLLNAALPSSRGTDELVGPFYDTKGLAGRWHISEQAVHKRADKAHKLLKVITKDDVALYPSFQFDARGTMLPSLPEVIDALSPAIIDRWTIARWLKAPSTRAGGRSPAELLRNGERDRALNLAASFSERLSA
jgi:hypothetical protein